MIIKLIKEVDTKSKKCKGGIHWYGCVTIAVCIIACIFAICINVMTMIKDGDNDTSTSAVSNPYEKGTVLHAAYELHNKDVTGTMEMSDLEDGTKVYYVLYEDNWTAYIYMHPDGTNSGKVENIP